MDTNPLFTFENSIHASMAVPHLLLPLSPPSPPRSTMANAGCPRLLLLLQPQPPFKPHVLVVLNIVNPNYQEWRCFFDSVIGKFGLTSHIATAPTAAQRADPG
jgi:hypothetical protein